jgi:primosomal protein N' (replication factor Y)
VQRRGALEAALRKIQCREVDVVVGTQMIAKGHDFPGVTLVGVVLADVALALPDFRAAERAFALLAQVAGRAGRGERAGRVLVQTYQPEHPALHFVVRHDVRGFAAHELALRQELSYPPYSRAALLRVEAPDARDAARLAADVAALARAGGQLSVAGPAPSPFERLQGRFRWQVFLRTTSAQSRAAALDAVRTDPHLRADLRRARARLILDVDPVHMV